jgi:hypothetical protein
VQGLPQFVISGLPDAACKQSPDQIKAAAADSDMSIPNRRLTVNLSPASTPKAGSGFDLAKVAQRSLIGARLERSAPRARRADVLLRRLTVAPTTDTRVRFAPSVRRGAVTVTLKPCLTLPSAAKPVTSRRGRAADQRSR